MNRCEETPIAFFLENRVVSLDIKTFEKMVLDKEFEKRAFAWRGESVVRRNIELLEE